MSQSITKNAIGIASKAMYAGGLKAASFHRQANHLYRECGGLFHGIHFQASQWGSAAEGSFTVNLVVTSPWLYSCWTGKPLPANPATALFPVQCRIGSLMPDGSDQWWSVSETTDLTALSEEVSAALLNYGLPFFEQYPNAQAILQKLRRGESLPGLSQPQLPLVRAMLAKEQGLVEEARAQISRAFRDAKFAGFRQTVQIVTERLDLAQVHHEGDA